MNKHMKKAKEACQERIKSVNKEKLETYFLKLITICNIANMNMYICPNYHRGNNSYIQLSYDFKKFKQISKHNILRKTTNFDYFFY